MRTSADSLDGVRASPSVMSPFSLQELGVVVSPPTPLHHKHELGVFIPLQHPCMN